MADQLGRWDSATQQYAAQGGGHEKPPRGAVRGVGFIDLGFRPRLGCDAGLAVATLQREGVRFAESWMNAVQLLDEVGVVTRQLHHGDDGRQMLLQPRVPNFFGQAAVQMRFLRVPLCLLLQFF